MASVILKEINSHTYKNERWHFFIVEEELLIGKYQEHFYLMFRDSTDVSPMIIQSEINYIKHVHKIELLGLALIDNDLFYQILEDVSLENAKRRDLNSSSIQQELEALLLNAVNRGRVIFTLPEVMSWQKLS